MSVHRQSAAAALSSGATCFPSALSIFTRDGTAPAAATASWLSGWLRASAVSVAVASARGRPLLPPATNLAKTLIAAVCPMASLSASLCSASFRSSTVACSRTSAPPRSICSTMAASVSSGFDASPERSMMARSCSTSPQRSMMARSLSLPEAVCSPATSCRARRAAVSCSTVEVAFAFAAGRSPESWSARSLAASISRIRSASVSTPCSFFLFLSFLEAAPAASTSGSSK
mmetsp:Transcript_81326/g.197454  ORF Transcript_81326/g.197454 Transcript_81326/m.197454 type:complete len:231 (-) Transcript_81326:13-705(-)